MRLQVLMVDGGLGVGLRGARGAWQQRAGLLLRVRDAAGRVGLGEAAPLPGYSTETLASCQQALEALARAGLDDLPGDEAAALSRVAQVSAAVAGGAAARCAVETALLDLLGQRAGQPLAVLLRRGWPLAGGGAHRAEPRPLDVPLSALLTGEDGESLIAQARAALARGLRTVKVKIGKPPGAAPRGPLTREARDQAFAQELRALAALRQALGDEVALRLDANGAFARDQAPARIAALLPLRPELIEEPLAPPVTPAALAALAALGVPLALDESLQGPSVEALIDSGGASAVVLKPMALGLLRCRELAARAHARGLALVVTHLLDGPVGLAAALALARSLRGDGARLLPCGLDRHPGLDAWPPCGGAVDAHGSLAGGRPGLGFTPPAGWPEVSP